MRKRMAVVAMSGGLDSSMAAYFLKQQGYNVVGITLKLYPEVSRCCRLEDIEDARRVAAFLKIPHYVFDFTEPFKKEIVDYFAKEYLSGRTPNPCAFCNWKIKFGLLFKKAIGIGASYLATGHYARIVWKDQEPYLAPAKDRSKSQEYFLAFVPPEVLKKVILPLGDFTKDEIQKLADKIGLPVRGKRESQDVCFVPDGDYIKFLREKYQVKLEPGKILDKFGRELGIHKGFLAYTIGQRKGLGISASKPLYVIEIDPEKNLLIVGDRQDTYKDWMKVKLFLWRGKEKGEYSVRIRYKHKPALAEIQVRNSFAEVKFHSPQFAPTPGQIAVFYDEEELVIGAGTIEEAR